LSFAGGWADMLNAANRSLRTEPDRGGAERTLAG
jgi:hypothetical protein